MEKWLKYLMNFIIPKTYTALETAVADAAHVKQLRMVAPKYNLKLYGGEFLKLKQLKKLEIQGTVDLTESTFSLPSEIGQLTQLETLILLNVPLSKFPAWINQLSNLQYLWVRGNDITEIPSFIQHLSKLKTLRVENCELNHLPKELRELRHLHELGLSDTKISYFSIDYLPPQLKVLDIGGLIFHYDLKELMRVKKALPNTAIHSMLKV